GVGQEDAGLAVLLLTQSATPLALDAAGVLPLLGEGAGIDDQDGAGVGQGLADVAAHLSHNGVVVPLATADEVLHGLTRAAGLGGDGLAGLALQAAEAVFEDDGGQLALLVAVEQGQVALQEARQAAAAADDEGGGQGGVL